MRSRRCSDGVPVARLSGENTITIAAEPKERGRIMISSAALFLFGAVQHASISVGTFHEPKIILAAVVEIMCGFSLPGVALQFWGIFPVSG
jgi:hypothetical protein